MESEGNKYTNWRDIEVRDLYHRKIGLRYIGGKIGVTKVQR